MYLEDHIDRIAHDIIDVADRFEWDDDDLIRQIADAVKRERERQEPAHH
jgi:hypothetical protein